MPTGDQVWSLTSYFPVFDGEEYRAFKASLGRDIAAQTGHAATTAALGMGNARAWACVFSAYEGIGARMGHLDSYLGCLAAAAAADERYQAELAWLSGLEADREKLKTELLRGLRAPAPEAWGSFLAEPELVGAAATLERLRREAGYRMSAAEEGLAADLTVDGFHAWGLLYQTIGGKMEFAMCWPDGRTEAVPMARCRALMAHSDLAVRQAAFTGGNAVWAGMGDTLGAALNAIAGTRLTLYGRRGRPDFLDAAREDNAISQRTIDAMFGAIAENYELPRRILRVGARRQNAAALAWFDLEAPKLPSGGPPVLWPDAVAILDRSFRASYPALHTYFRRAIADRWVESEARANKRPGGFCTDSPVTGEQRIYLTYADTMHDVSTLAHEFGHAWHSHLLAGLRPCARQYPMTLAETASTFAELVLAHGLLGERDLAPERRAYLLDLATGSAPTYLLNISVRYEFERQFYAERQTGTVSVSRLCALMVETQRRIYGDVLAPGQEDPWFWASKLHFYFTEASFYNFPYTFGFLLSRALFQEFRREGAAFLPRYETFLRLTGSASCEEVVCRVLGRDIGDPQFWRDVLAGLAGTVAEFESAAAGIRPS
jgi:oligoendopeptidase F